MTHLSLVFSCDFVSTHSFFVKHSNGGYGDRLYPPRSFVRLRVLFIRSVDRDHGSLFDCFLACGVRVSHHVASGLHLLFSASTSLVRYWTSRTMHYALHSCSLHKSPLSFKRCDIVSRCSPALRRRPRVRVEASVVESERPTPLTYPYSEGPLIIDGQVAHSMTEQRYEIVQSLEPFLKKEARFMSYVLR